MINKVAWKKYLVSGFSSESNLSPDLLLKGDLKISIESIWMQTKKWSNFINQKCIQMFWMKIWRPCFGGIKEQNQRFELKLESNVIKPRRGWISIEPLRKITKPDVKGPQIWKQKAIKPKK
jgi:hypothetical protein